MEAADRYWQAVDKSKWIKIQELDEFGEAMADSDKPSDREKQCFTYFVYSESGVLSISTGDVVRGSGCCGVVSVGIGPHRIWIWKRNLTMSLWVSRGRCFEILGHWAIQSLHKQSSVCIAGSQSDIVNH